MSHAIELFQPPQVNTVQSRRATLALLIAVALHAVLLALPYSLDRNPPLHSAPIHITIVQPPEPEVVPAPTEPVDQSGKPALPVKSEPPVAAVKPADPAPPTDTIRKEQRPRAPDKDPQPIVDRSLQPIAPEPGAKSPSTVFDPRLAEKLARERNRVQKFASGDAEYMTATGTFVQQGDRCWEVKQLIPGDTSVESSQWLRMKCPKTSRSKSDIDRLARKYGIP